ncbi:Enolase-phosphatase E1 [Phlyctochytrium bullatum]|nr:Enolase-phosphatase E1 [Phlyctochytrium bullatum]
MGSPEKRKADDVTEKNGEVDASRKKHAAEVSLPYKVVVVDIEGTTTPISFVHDVLFPYVSNNIDEFLSENWGATELEEKVQVLREQAAKDVKEGVAGAVAILPKDHADVDALKKSIADNIRWQVKADRKIGALKSFQGYMWRFAYESGKVKGSVFDDVVPVLDAWIKKGLKVYVYSSGSIEAQKLLFGYSEKGDILDRFSGHFDTTIGSKLEPSSYEKIADTILADAASSQPDKALEKSSILFLSDNPVEIAAAKSVGYRVSVLRRPGNAALELVPDREGKSTRAFVKDMRTGKDKDAKVDALVVDHFESLLEADVLKEL